MSRRLFTAFTHTYMCTNTCMCSIFLHSEMQGRIFYFFYFFSLHFHMPDFYWNEKNGHYRLIKPVQSGGNLHFPRWQHTWTDLVHSSVVLSVMISRCSCHAVVCYDRITTYCSSSAVNNCFLPPVTDLAIVQKHDEWLGCKIWFSMLQYCIYTSMR